MTSSNHKRNALLCAFFVGACLLAALPFAEMGFIDDWSYIKTAQVFANTGHFVYNGWTAAMLGWQIPVAAFFIKLFGFSFTIARLSTLPAYMASAYLFYLILVRFGINAGNATFGTLLLLLSPVVLPLAFSFMSDVPGLFVVLLCVYLCQNAIAARTAAATIAWLCLAAATNVIGGSVRQIAWLGALAVIPGTAWLLRKRRGVLLAAAVFLVVSLISVLAMLHWFGKQPYTIGERLIKPHTTIHEWRHLADQFIRLILVVFFLLLPLSLAWLVGMMRRGKFAILRLLVYTAIWCAIYLVLFRHGTLRVWYLPWLPHVIESLGVADPAIPEMLGPRTLILGVPCKLALSLLTGISSFVLVDWLIAALWIRRSALPQNRDGQWTNILWLLGPLFVCYVLLLLPRALYIIMFDRYAIELVAIATVVLLKLYQENIARRLPAISVLALLTFSIFTIAATHDWFSLYRARVKATNDLTDSGIPRTAIQGGFDYDGWTEIEASGFINDSRIKIPANAYHEVVSPTDLAAECNYWFSDWTPSIHPKYFVVRNQLDCLDDTSYPAVSYRTWLPPFRRYIYIKQKK